MENWIGENIHFLGYRLRFVSDYITILEYIITTFEENWKRCPKLLSSFLHNSLITES